MNVYPLSSPLALVIDNLLPALSVNEPELIELPLRVSADEAVPDCEVEIESASTAPDIFKNPSRLLPIASITIDDEAPIDPEVME